MTDKDEAPAPDALIARKPVIGTNSAYVLQWCREAADALAALTAERDRWRFDSMNMTDEACRQGDRATKAEAALAERDAEIARLRSVMPREPTQVMMDAVRGLKMVAEQKRYLWRAMWDAAQVPPPAPAADAPPIVGWMVGTDPQTAAMYNAGEQEKAHDAAKRWNRSITGLVLHPDAPRLAAPTPDDALIAEQKAHPGLYGAWGQQAADRIAAQALDVAATFEAGLRHAARAQRAEAERDEAKELATRSTRRLVELSEPGSIGAFAARDAALARATKAEAALAERECAECGANLVCDYDRRHAALAAKD